MSSIWSPTSAIQRCLAFWFPSFRKACTKQMTRDTPLVGTIKNIQAPGNRYESAKILLLQSSTDWSTCPQRAKQDPLRVAVRLGDLEMCDLLVSTGNIDPRPALACDDEGRIVLRDNSPENAEMIPQILESLCTHADLEPGLAPR